MDRPEAPFRQIAEALREQIRSGELKPGDRVQSTRDLAEQWGVARATVDRALGLLRDEGLVQVSAGRAGTMVAKEGSLTDLVLVVDGSQISAVEAVDVVTLDTAQATALGVAPGSSLLKITMRLLST